MGHAKGGQPGLRRTWPARILREPLLAFAVIGGLLLLVYRAQQSHDAEPIVLSAANRALLIAEFDSLTGRTATTADITRIEQDFIADEVLFREALAEGLHLTDSTVRARLVEEMRLRITGPLPEATAEELVNYYSGHLERYQSEPAVTFRHVYFVQRPADPQALLQQLRAGRIVTGETFGRGAEFSGYGQSMLRGLFGQAFTAALWTAPSGEWTGPLQSQYGWHYVLVSERLLPALLPFDVVRQQVENDLAVDTIDGAVAQHVHQSLPRYAVKVER